MKHLVELLVHNVMGFGHESALGHTINFFIYDSIKLLFLLVAMIYILSFLRTYVPEDKLRKYLGGNNKVLAAFFAA
ncbi:MAG: permease, partial [Elusimicrobiaceae bacterium]|nr:permease [Elusimicrobiaceae bacterium]